MTTITLDLAKAHLKIDGTTEDELLTLYIEAAEQQAANYIGKELSEFDPLPADLKLALLRLVAFFYECRNIAVFGITSQIAPLNIATVFDAYRERWFHDDEE
nr:head-tail connector protein [uncultured Cohaesibacter sp.]